MVSGWLIVILAVCYALALALELTRLWFRSAARGALLRGAALLGLAVHTAYLYLRWARAEGMPLSSPLDFFMATAWFVMGVYFYLTFYHPQTSFGLFLLPLVLALIAIAACVASPLPFPRERASKIWGILHAMSIVLATVSVLVGFVAGLMYLHQAAVLKRKRPPNRVLRLPSLEWLQRTNARAVALAMLLLATGIASGATLNAIRKAEGSAHLPWNDPIVLSTVLMLAWLLLSAAASWIYRPALQGRKVAYLTLVSFVFLVIALAMGLMLTQHGGRQGAGPMGRAVGCLRLGTGSVLGSSRHGPGTRLAAETCACPLVGEGEQA